MSDQLPKLPPTSESVTPPPAPRAAERRRSPGGVYDWLIPVILIFLAFVLASIIIASVLAMVGVWPVP
jgi:hypothetical protein